MKIRTVAASGVGLALAFALAATASAQTPRPSAPSSAAPSSSSGESKGDVDFGVNFGNWVRNRGVINLYKKGWHAGASYRITHLISVISEISADYRQLPGFTAKLYTYAGGARFQSGTTGTHLSPFAQIVIGGGQDNDDGAKTNHYPIVSPAGGVDLGLGQHAALRLRADFPLYMTFGDVFKGARLSAGLSFPFGKR